jgi:DNA-binding GntR family transcriptional regulator
MISQDQRIKTNSQREMARILESTERTNPRVTTIAQSIGCAIIDGHLKPGDDLNTVDLSKQFQTSRTPIKEALLLLEKEGLVTIPPYRRPFVAQTSLKEVHEIFQIREKLLMLVAELIVNTASDEDIASLRVFLPFIHDMMAAHDIDGVFWTYTAFRNREAEICGNRQLRHTLDSLELRTLQLRRLSINLGHTHAEHWLSDRERLVRAYEERDTLLAIALTRTMVLESLKMVEQSECVR